jgi:anti-sigma B factor antagonist
MSLSLHTSFAGGTAVVSVTGEIDLQNSGELRKELLARLGDRVNLVVELSHVDYIDSSGVAGLIEAYQMARNLNLRFALASPSGAVLRVLKLARLDEVLVIQAGTDTSEGS